MSINASGFGAGLRIIASVTFPLGFDFTQFPADTDPFDVPLVQTAETEVGPNGDLIFWTRANPIIITLGAVADSPDDKNLRILLTANMSLKNKRLAYDKITMTAIYPTGGYTNLYDGVITGGMPVASISGQGKLKTKNYTFAFGGVSQG
jgi:hypothetical protein